MADLDTAAEQLRHVGDAWKRVHEQSHNAADTAAGYIKTLLGFGAASSVFKYVADKHKDKVAALMDPKLKMSGTDKLNAEIEEARVAQAKLVRQSDVLEAKIKHFKELGGARTAEDTHKMLEAQATHADLAYDIKRNEERQGMLGASGPKMARLDLVEAQIKLLKSWQVVLAGAVVEETVRRWYSFNEAVRQTNVSLGDRRGLFKVANDEASKLGLTLGTVGQTMEVLRGRGITLAASLDPSRRAMGELALRPIDAADHLADVIQVATRLNDALGLGPHEVDDLIATAQRLRGSFSDVGDEVATLNQKLGLSGAEAANIVSQVGQIALPYNLSENAALGTSNFVGQLQAASKPAGNQDPQWAVKILNQLTTTGTQLNQLALTRGGAQNLLNDPAALERFLNQVLNFGGLRQLYTRSQQPGGAFANFQFQNQVQGLLGLDASDAALLIRSLDNLHRAFGQGATDLNRRLKLEDVARSQLKLTGEVWQRLGLQLVGLIASGLEPLTKGVQVLSGYVDDLYGKLRDLNPQLKEGLKGFAALGAMTATVFGIFTVIQGALRVALALMGVGTAAGAAAAGTAGGTAAAAGLGAGGAIRMLLVGTDLGASVAIPVILAGGLGVLLARYLDARTKGEFSEGVRNIDRGLGPWNFGPGARQHQLIARLTKDLTDPNLTVTSGLTILQSVPKSPQNLENEKKILHDQMVKLQVRAATDDDAEDQTNVYAQLKVVTELLRQLNVTATDHKNVTTDAHNTTKRITIRAASQYQEDRFQRGAGNLLSPGPALPA
jgi:hypothetical protein